MWALRPAYYDNDAPMDLRKKVVLQRDLEEQKESRQHSTVLTASSTNFYREKRHQPPTLPVANLYPFVSEKYSGQCALVSPDENRLQDTRHGRSLETAIRKLHHSRQLKRATENTKPLRSRSADETLFPKSAFKQRSNSCPNLIFTNKPAPPLKPRSPIKPKSYFIQRSSGHLSENSPDSIANSYHRTYENYRANSPILGGAKKRKSFVPVYGERSLSPKRVYDDRTSSPKRIYDERTSSPKRVYDDRTFSPRRAYDDRTSSPRRIYDDRTCSPRRVYDDRTSSPRRVYDDRTSSPRMEYGHMPRSPKRRARSPEAPPEEYFPHSEVLLRRQLQQQTSPAYLVHVYDYYQQLVQRLREQTSPGVRLPPPMSPNSVDDDMTPDSQRKRPCRALTGKHVRQGTGASLSTLLTLRQKIQERQKAKEHEPVNGFNGTGNKMGACPKKNKPQKLKPVMKSVLNKLHNC